MNRLLNITPFCLFYLANPLLGGAIGPIINFYIVRWMFELLQIRRHEGDFYETYREAMVKEDNDALESLSWHGIKQFLCGSLVRKMLRASFVGLYFIVGGGSVLWKKLIVQSPVKSVPLFRRPMITMRVLSNIPK